MTPLFLLPGSLVGTALFGRLYVEIEKECAGRSNRRHFLIRAACAWVWSALAAKLVTAAVMLSIQGVK